MRIVSLLPSATEICYALGLDEQLVGVTHECDYPPEALNKPKITASQSHDGLTSREIDDLVRSQLDHTGSIYELDLVKLEELKPDLILTQRLCTVCAVSFDFVKSEAAKLSTKPQVINLEPFTLGEVLDTIKEVASLTGTHGESAVDALKKRRDHVIAAVSSLPQPRAMVLEWIDPPFASGHWIPELTELAGAIDVLGFKHAPSQQVTWEAVREAKPDIIVVAECGFGVERQLQDLQTLYDNLGDWKPEVWVSDGSQYFSRPGPRLIDTLEILAGIFHPELREQFHSRFVIDKDVRRI